MPIQFPRDLPMDGVDTQSFELQRVDLTTQQVNGRASGVTLGWPLWRTVITLANTDADETAIWRAWVSTLRGVQRTFLGRDLTRPLPLAHRAGFAGMTRATGGAYDGTSGWSMNADRDAVSLTGLPSGLTLSLGDYGMFRWGGSGDGARRALVRFVEAGSATSDGNLSLTVEPPVPTLVPAGAVFDLVRPSCVMRLMPDETSIGPLDALHGAGGTITAIQDLRS